MGPKFSRRSDAHQVGPKARRQHSGIGDDGQKSPERRRGQGQTHDQGVERQATRDQDKGKTERQTERDQPAEQRQAQGRPLDAVEFQLVARKEHEVGESHVGKGLDQSVGVCQLQDIGADKYPEQQLDHDRRNTEPSCLFGDDGSQDRAPAMSARVGMAASIIVVPAPICARGRRRRQPFAEC